MGYIFHNESYFQNYYRNFNFYQKVTYDSKILSRKITIRTKFDKDGFGTYVGVRGV